VPTTYMKKTSKNKRRGQGTTLLNARLAKMFTMNGIMWLGNNHKIC